jgi:endonuclease/exonuclease/phosphatase family metal-dependent hydrolase
VIRLAFAALALGLTLAPAAAAATPFKVLQLNLCNSGLAGCYEDGKSIGEGIAKIESEQPDVVSVNEVCDDDVARMGNETGYTAYFFPARKRTGSETPPPAYLCKNGHEYGIGFLARPNHGDLVNIPQYRWYANQDGGSSEMRVMACGEYSEFVFCTTHLATVGSVAMKQCQELMTEAVGHAAHKPTVIAGDLNMRYQGSPNVQACVPSGFFRKGDGSVQHVIAQQSAFGFSSTRTLSMSYTDHPGFVVNLLKN